MKKKKSNLQLQEKEVVSKRGVSSKTFQKKRGKFETKYYHKPIHQFDEISGCFIESAADKQNSKMTKLPGIIVKTEDAIQGEKLNVGKKGVQFEMNLPPRREGVITQKVPRLEQRAFSMIRMRCAAVLEGRKRFSRAMITPSFSASGRRTSSWRRERSTAPSRSARSIAPDSGAKRSTRRVRAVCMVSTFAPISAVARRESSMT